MHSWLCSWAWNFPICIQNEADGTIEEDLEIMQRLMMHRKYSMNNSSSIKSGDSYSMFIDMATDIVVKQVATTTSKAHQLEPHKKEMDHTKWT
ncbi:hypothetical protein MTR_5g096520 [Medicago truncatula]|uniref:Uncharacterized protein n=1 Tax=Medicago truncatula TaxID=3880 RepID=G7K4S1_MEDTR|nr:hypothetical protein MTR_5g096520 [Medicago truncatula]